MTGRAMCGRPQAKEVKDLQGALADQNIILDTVGTGGPLAGAYTRPLLSST